MEKLFYKSSIGKHKDKPLQPVKPFLFYNIEILGKNSLIRYICYIGLFLPNKTFQSDSLPPTSTGFETQTPIQKTPSVFNGLPHGKNSQTFESQTLRQKLLNHFN
jgi:hypothetical protein